jgi:hypothetical protein
MTAEYLRLKENHPLLVKIETIFALMEEYGLSFTMNGNQCFVTSEKDNYSNIQIQDIEYNDCGNLPPTMEYKVICDNPKYLEEREAEIAAGREQRRLKEVAEKEERDRKLKEAEIKRLRDIETSERYMLNLLKKKYPDQ